jgi:hypothetical protein
VRQQVGFEQAAALHQRQGAGGSESSGGVGGASVGGLGLDVFHSAEEEGGVLMLERGQGSAFLAQH